MQALCRSQPGETLTDTGYNFRRSLLLSHDGYWIFVNRPVSAVLLAIDVALIAGAIWFAMRRRDTA